MSVGAGHSGDSGLFDGVRYDAMVVTVFPPFSVYTHSILTLLFRSAWMYLSCHRFVHAGELNWAEMSVAGLCVGIDKYTHAGNLNNASRDAEAMNKRRNSLSGCQSANLCAPATVGALLRGIHHHAQDAGLQQNPPKLFMVYDAGHGIQKQEGLSGAKQRSRGAS